MIPKKNHYCWFGGKKTLMIKICIESWKRILPDFKIIEWNETNIDMRSSPYIEKTYQDNNWAFVADYVRFKVLYENGGLYFDTDVFKKKI